MAISDKIKKAMGKDDPSINFPIRMKKSERMNWEKLAKKNGFTSTAGLIKFLVNKAENEPSKVFG